MAQNVDRDIRSEVVIAELLRGYIELGVADDEAIEQRVTRKKPAVVARYGELFVPFINSGEIDFVVVIHAKTVNIAQVALTNFADGVFAQQRGVLGKEDKDDAVAELLGEAQQGFWRNRGVTCKDVVKKRTAKLRVVTIERLGDLCFGLGALLFELKGKVTCKALM